MARNSEFAPTEPPGRRRKSTEGGSRLRDEFRNSIRDALSGVDVDELQGRRTIPVPDDVSLLTRESVSDLEAELASLRAERAELEQRRAAAAAPPSRPRTSSTAWSPSRAMAPVQAPGRDAREARPAAKEPPTAPPTPSRTPLPPRPSAAPRSLDSSAPPQTPLSDAELESAVAPLLAELASLRDEVRELRGEPAAVPGRNSNRQLARLVVGVLVGFALIVVALAVVLKA